jgi:hypothetical protein
VGPFRRWDEGGLTTRKKDIGNVFSLEMESITRAMQPDTPQEHKNRRKQERNDKNIAKEKRKVRHSGRPYLVAVHFEFAHDLDGHLTQFSGSILCAVDIAERAIAHFLHQKPAIEAGILRHLRAACFLFLHKAFDVRGPIVLHLSVGFLLNGLTITSRVACVESSKIRGELALWLWLLFGVDGGHIGSGFGMGCYEASLFSMSDEILDILYRAHDGNVQGE